MAPPREEASEIEEKAKKWLRSEARGEWDLMVIGHVHHGFNLNHSGYRMTALPGWLDPARLRPAPGWRVPPLPLPRGYPRKRNLTCQEPYQTRFSENLCPFSKPSIVMSWYA